METNLKFNSAICTSRQQSERLLALGLKKETADCRHWAYTKDSKGSPIPKKSQKWFTRIGADESAQVCGFMDTTFIPAWSLHRLLCLLPTEYIADIDFQQVMQDFVFGSQDMYDEVISCIETLIEAGYFYEEYLEE